MTEPGLPLAGLRVLDISSFIAAPAAAVVLGDWGADVIKVEGPDGDPNRRIMHDSSNYPKGAVNYPWHMDSRNKRSIVLDLKKPDARAALDRLIVLSDVLICNFPPLVRDKLKLGYDDVKRVNPKLVYASLTGYGEAGPDRDRPGFDATAYFARSGLLDAQRYEDGPPGVPVPAQGDRATAMALVSAILDRGEARVVCKIRAADGGADAGPHLVLAYDGELQPAIVARAIDVAEGRARPVGRRAVRQVGADQGGLGDDTARPQAVAQQRRADP